eukprot:scaffold2603_cov100-Isochrysis_galbana.AAC.4
MRTEIRDAMWAVYGSKVEVANRRLAPSPASTPERPVAAAAAAAAARSSMKCTQLAIPPTTTLRSAGIQRPDTCPNASAT